MGQTFRCSKSLMRSQFQSSKDFEHPSTSSFLIYTFILKLGRSRPSLQDYLPWKTLLCIIQTASNAYMVIFTNFQLHVSEFVYINRTLQTYLRLITVGSTLFMAIVLRRFQPIFLLLWVILSSSLLTLMPTCIMTTSPDDHHRNPTV